VNSIPLCTPTPSCLVTPWAPVVGGCLPSSSCFLATFFSLCLRSRSSGSLSFSRSRGARFFFRLCSSLSTLSECAHRVSTFLSTTDSILSRMLSSLEPDGIDVLLPPLSNISSTVVSHFLK
jgi:hypothetical protein